MNPDTTKNHPSTTPEPQLEGADPEKTAGILKILLGFRMTQMIFGRSAVRGQRTYLYYAAIRRLLRKAPHAGLLIVTKEQS